MGASLDEIDQQVAALGAPVARTLDHVNGIASTADETLARVGGAVGQLEGVASTAAKGVDLVGAAVQPAIVNLGSTLTGITAGLRRLVRPRGEMMKFILLDSSSERSPVQRSRC